MSSGSLPFTVPTNSSLGRISFNRLTFRSLPNPSHLLTIVQIGAQGSSPELLSVDREINFPQYCLLLKHFVSRTSFIDVFFLFEWLSMLSGRLSLGLPLGLFPFIFNVITTLSVDSYSLVMTVHRHDMAKPSKLVLVDSLNNG